MVVSIALSRNCCYPLPRPDCAAVSQRRPRRSKAQIATVCALEAPLEASLASFGVAGQEALYEAAPAGVPTQLEALLDSSSERRNQLWGQMQKLGAGLADPTTRRAEEVSAAAGERDNGRAKNAACQRLCGTEERQSQKPQMRRPELGAVGLPTDPERLCEASAFEAGALTCLLCGALMQVRLQLAGSLAQEAFLQLRLAQLKGKQPQFAVTEEEPFIKEARRKRGRRGLIDTGIDDGYSSLKLDQSHSVYQAVEHHPPPMMMHYDPQQQHQMMLLHHGTHFGVMPHLPQTLHHPQL